MSKTEEESSGAENGEGQPAAPSTADASAPSSRKAVSWFWRIFLLGVFAFVLLMTLSGCFEGFFEARSIYREQASKQWPATAGTIQAVEREAESGTRGGSVHYTHVRYRYAVNGSPYDGETVDPPDFSARDLSRMLAARGVITVHYSLADHSISVFDPGFRWIRVNKLMHYALWHFFGGAVLLFWLWVKRSPAGDGRIHKRSDFPPSSENSG
jgi:Protein of unknown function (DUF3592)